MTQHAITPLSMSQTKEELRRHLNMSTQTYDMMALETAQIYTVLVRNPLNFKQQPSIPVPPFDWSDITELAKQEAACALSQSNNPQTRCFWDLGETSTNGNNWVAIWFLYHKFRYRDGRNRAKNPKKGTNKHQRSGSDGKKSSIRSSSSRGSVSSSYQSSPARSSEVSTQAVYYQPASMYAPSAYAQPVAQQSGSGSSSSGSQYFDPIRNEFTSRQ